MLALHRAWDSMRPETRAAIWPYSFEELVWYREAWSDELDVALFPEYSEPPLPPTAKKRLTKEEELALFEERAGKADAADKPVFGLRHPKDTLPDDVDGASEQAGKGRVRLGLRTTRQEAKSAALEETAKAGLRLAGKETQKKKAA